jgi:hypothetical protein
MLPKRLGEILSEATRVRARKGMKMPKRNDPCVCGSGKKYKKCCGTAVKQFLPTGTAARGVTVTDPIARRHYKVDPEALLNQLHREHPKIAASFDANFGEEVKAISSRHARSMALIAAGFREFHGDASRAQQIMAVLLLNASHTLTAAIDVLRDGYRLQPGILLRNVIETLATVSYLVVEPTGVTSYDEGDLKSAQTITKAKEVLPIFGRMYGFFSQEFAHLGTMHQRLHTLSTYEPNEQAARINLALIRVVVVLFSMRTLSIGGAKQGADLYLIQGLKS